MSKPLLFVFALLTFTGCLGGPDDDFGTDEELRRRRSYRLPSQGPQPTDANDPSPSASPSPAPTPPVPTGTPTVCSGNCAYVTSAGTGNRSGSDWNNACAGFSGSCASANLLRGGVYFVAGGSYSGFTFSTPVSGSKLITIKKATSNDHGDAPGWSDSLGSTQAIFGGAISFGTSYWLFDGNAGSMTTDASAYGFAFPVRQGAGNIFLGTAAGQNITDITLSHIYASSTATSIAGTKYFIVTQGQIASTARITVSHNFGDRWQVFVMLASNHQNAHSDYLIENNLVMHSVSYPSDHGSVIDVNYGNVTNLIVRNNIFSGSTGGTATVEANNSNINSAQVYGNVFDSIINGNGVVSGTSAGTMNNTLVYGNTFTNCRAVAMINGHGVGGACGTGNVAYNNLFYNNKNYDGGTLTGLSVSCVTAPSSNNITVTSSPFVNAAALDFHLTAATPAGMTLPAPFDLDLDGVPRSSDGVWDIGAYEF